MKRLILSIFVAVAGGLLVLIGGSALFFPDAFFATNGIVLPNDPSLRSEIRAPAGLLLLSGVIVMVSAFQRRIALLGLGLTALVYETYAVSRLVSLALDGTPAEGLLQAMVIEFVVGTIALVALLRGRNLDT